MHSKLNPVIVIFLCLIIAGLAYTHGGQLPGTSTQNGSGAPSGSCVSGSTYTDSSTGYAWSCKGSVWVLGATSGMMTGTTASIGGGALLAGACASGTATVTGATVGMPTIATPSDGTNIAALGTSITATVTATNTVTVNVCALLALTPTSKTYSVRVLP
jgi:hypothetical protein